MNDQRENWFNQYKKYINTPLYPTEWVIRTIAGGNYPNLKMDKRYYKGRRILDMSCGDGRNLQLLLNLGFEVFASEISDSILIPLKEKFPEIKFGIGFNNNQPFQDYFFDYILSCSACYYLEPGVSFHDNLNEIGRILKPDAFFIGNVPDIDNSVVNNSDINSLGEVTIVNDPFNLRNGYRFQVFKNKDNLHKQLSTIFKNITIGSFSDDYYGLKVSGYMFVAQKV